jgi:DNA-binding response OmpR family regulator
MERERHCKLENLTRWSLQCQPHRPGRILVVDDDPHECNAQALRQHGYEVAAARDGAAGWQQLQTHPFNLLITANDLPVLSGVGLLRNMQAACMFLPVIVVIETLPSWQSADYPWLLKATKLIRPYNLGHLLGLVNQLLTLPVRIEERTAPQPNRQNWTASVA